jgi:hypothetical protein
MLTMKMKRLTPCSFFSSPGFGLRTLDIHAFVVASLLPSSLVCLDLDLLSKYPTYPPSVLVVVPPVEAVHLVVAVSPVILLSYLLDQAFDGILSVLEVSVLSWELLSSLLLSSQEVIPLVISAVVVVKLSVFELAILVVMPSVSEPATLVVKPSVSGPADSRSSASNHLPVVEPVKPVVEPLVALSLGATFFPSFPSLLVVSETLLW